MVSLDQSATLRISDVVTPGGDTPLSDPRGPVRVKSTHFFSQWQIPQMVAKYTLKPLMVANEKTTVNGKILAKVHRYSRRLSFLVSYLIW